MMEKKQAAWTSQRIYLQALGAVITAGAGVQFPALTQVFNTGNIPLTLAGYSTVVPILTRPAGSLVAVYSVINVVTPNAVGTLSMQLRLGVGPAGVLIILDTAQANKGNGCASEFGLFRNSTGEEDLAYTVSINPSVGAVGNPVIDIHHFITLWFPPS